MLVQVMSDWGALFLLEAQTNDFSDLGGEHRGGGEGRHEGMKPMGMSLIASMTVLASILSSCGAVSEH